MWFIAHAAVDVAKGNSGSLGRLVCHTYSSGSNACAIPSCAGTVRLLDDFRRQDNLTIQAMLICKQR
jgi:hypothetical protein